MISNCEHTRFSASSLREYATHGFLITIFNGFIKYFDVLLKGSVVMSYVYVVVEEAFPLVNFRISKLGDWLFDEAIKECHLIGCYPHSYPNA